MTTKGYLLVEDLTASPNAKVERVMRLSDQKVFIHKYVNLTDNREYAMHLFVQMANSNGPRHVVRAFSAWEDKHDFIMELENFEDSLDSIPPESMQPVVLLNVARETVAGMKELDNASICNDDLKPANFVFKAKSTRIALCDLGVARFYFDDQLQGYTPSFAAPELLENKTSRTAQIYAWAASMEFMLLGAIGPSSEGINLSELIPWVGSEFGEILRL